MMTSLKDDRETQAKPVAATRNRPGTTRRGAYLRDGLVLLVLSLITVVLFGVTLFLFKSFEAHRADLGVRWSSRGRLALAQGHPQLAASALRTALSYTPDNYDDQLLLAQALAGAGQLEAANNYFLSLWEVHPGEGFLNLQLARLARQRGDSQEAVNYYRASIFGNWEQSGVQRRREVRLELADYLVERGQAPAAQAELLIAAGNAPEKDVALQLEIADRLRALGDTTDALRFYKVAAAQNPHNPVAVADEGRAEYAIGDYGAAARSFIAAAELARHTGAGAGAVAELSSLAAAAHRLPELSLSRDLSAQERAAHILLDAGIAQSHLKSCTVKLITAALPALRAKSASTAPPSSPAVPGVLNDLQTQWALQSRFLTKRTLARDSALEDAVAQLIDSTELGMAPVCGAPTGDDELLLHLARRAQPGGGEAQ